MNYYVIFAQLRMRGLHLVRFVIFKFETSAYSNGLPLKMCTHPKPVTTLQISALEVHAGRAHVKPINYRL